MNKTTIAKKPGKTSALLMTNKMLSAKKTVQFWADLKIAAEKATLIDKHLSRSSTNFDQLDSTKKKLKKVAAKEKKGKAGHTRG